MIRALWTATSGMNAQQLNVDVIANNLANVNTAGFKKSQVDFQDLLYQAMRSPGGVSNNGAELPTGLQVGLGTRVVSTNKIFGQGNYRETQNPLDLIVEGDGFFKVQSPTGETLYTRAGNFKLDSTGRVVTGEGWLLTPQVTIPATATTITVGNDGSVSVVDGTTGQIQDLGTPIEIAKFQNPSGLVSVGRSAFRESASSGAAVSGVPGQNGLGSISQGFVEMSNVSVVEEMVNLIAGQRAYEINSKAIHSADEMLQIANAIKKA